MSSAANNFPNITDKLSIEANSVDPEQTAPKNCMVLSYKLHLRVKEKVGDNALIEKVEAQKKVVKSKAPSKVLDIQEKSIALIFQREMI